MFITRETVIGMVEWIIDDPSIVFWLMYREIEHLTHSAKFRFWISWPGLKLEMDHKIKNHNHLSTTICLVG